jgi:hypothetical protein
LQAVVAVPNMTLVSMGEREVERMVAADILHLGHLPDVALNVW